MKFQLVINMERMSATADMQAIARHTLEMVQMADAGGFEIVWAAEHYGIEMTIAPNPFQILTWFAAHTDRIRLGSAVVVAAYNHPIPVAGQAALVDLYSGGRLEFGIGSGAYQWEFDRMKPGLEQQQAYRYVQEMIPAVKALWQGDYAHQGEFWQFPMTTSVPKPVQRPHPPLWVAARSPVTFDFAARNDCHIMSWALARPVSEVQIYLDRFEKALKDNNVSVRPIFATMRQTAVYARPDDADPYLDALITKSGRFENLFQNLADVRDGFPEPVDLKQISTRSEFDRATLRTNLMFGTPSEVIEKLIAYDRLGVDHFIYSASYGLDMALQKQSLKLFIDEVMPAFNNGA
jgi:alkanesulfonate monooxygenase SsuD/methylene tetrahydromethanopterin reductase-like flavin-dependent oxidoreductase (luciferase family)